MLFFLPFKGDHDPMADRNIGRYGNHPPAFRGQPVHFPFSRADAADFHTILVHRYFLRFMHRSSGTYRRYHRQARKNRIKDAKYIWLFFRNLNSRASAEPSPWCLCRIQSRKTCRIVFAAHETGQDNMQVIALLSIITYNNRESEGIPWSAIYRLLRLLFRC